MRMLKMAVHKLLPFDASCKTPGIHIGPRLHLRLCGELLDLAHLHEDSPAKSKPSKPDSRRCLLLSRGQADEDRQYYLDCTGLYLPDGRRPLVGQRRHGKAAGRVDCLPARWIDGLTARRLYWLTAGGIDHPETKATGGGPMMTAGIAWIALNVTILVREWFGYARIWTRIKRRLSR